MEADESRVEIATRSNNQVTRRHSNEWRERRVLSTSLIMLTVLTMVAPRRASLLPGVPDSELARTRTKFLTAVRHQPLRSGASVRHRP